MLNIIYVKMCKLPTGPNRWRCASQWEIFASRNDERKWEEESNIGKFWVLKSVGKGNIRQSDFMPWKNYSKIVCYKDIEKGSYYTEGWSETHHGRKQSPSKNKSSLLNCKFKKCLLATKNLLKFYFFPVIKVFLPNERAIMFCHGGKF